MTAIRLHALSKSYGSSRVLNDVDLDVPNRCVLALLGPSGCGKTTLLRLIAGFERADAGTIGIGAQTVDCDTAFVAPERRRIGYVPQEGALFPHLTVSKNIGFGLTERPDRHTRIADMLRLLGLAEHADKYPRELSGGQQQRVALARALAPEPSIILLDEPFNALDLDLRRRMSAEVISLLRDTGTTTVLVTHDPAEAFATSDLVAVMQNGAIMQCGTPALVYKRPVSVEVARLTGAAIFLDGQVRGGMAHTVLGPIPIDGSGPGTAAEVTVLLRPEQLQVDGTRGDAEAKVVASRFHGDHVMLTVDLDGASVNLRALEAPSGARVFLRVRGSCRVFAAEGTRHPPTQRQRIDALLEPEPGE
jgi:iron(III) transport system ATP-binding protein